jgi:hypothetical protein
MAELTTLESSIGQVLGLAMASQTASERVAELAGEEPELVNLVTDICAEAVETQVRCMAVVSRIKSRKAAVMREASRTWRRSGRRMRTYIDADAGVLDGFEYMTMAEAEEVGHWCVLEQISGGHPELAELCRWAIQVHEQHVADANAVRKQLMDYEVPTAVAS